MPAIYENVKTIASQQKAYSVGDQPAIGRDWKRSTADYRRLMAFQFASQEYLDIALAVFFEEPDIIGAPFRAVGKETIFVPEEAASSLAEHFRARAIAFEVSKVHKRSDFPANVLAEARRKQILGY